MTKSRCVYVRRRLQSVRNHLRVSRIPGSRETGVLVAMRGTVATFGLAFGLRVSKVSTSTGIGGSWSRNAELSSLLDLLLVLEGRGERR